VAHLGEASTRARLPAISARAAGYAALFLLLGLTGGWLITVNWMLAVLMAAAVLGAGLITMRSGHRAMVRAIAPPYRWVPFGWIVLLFVSVLSFEYRSPLEAAAGGASKENIIELTMYLLVAVFAANHWKHVAESAPLRLRTGVFLAWPVFSIASTLWSVTPIFTLARSLQLLVPISLAILGARIWSASRAEGERIWNATARMLVQITTVLVLLGFAFRDWPDNRFTWPGTHPGFAATIIATNLLVLLIGGRAMVRLSVVGYWARVALFGAAFVFAQTRSVLLGFLLALLSAVWLAGRKLPIARYLGLFYFVCIAITLGVLARNELLLYVERGASEGELTSLSGRIPLWEFAIEASNTLRTRLIGFGYGSSRTILFPRVPWAGDAHNAWLEFFLGTGIIGAVLAFVALVFLGYKLIRQTMGQSHRIYLVATSIFTMEMVISVAGASVSQPGYSFSMMCFLLAAALAQPASHESPSRPTNNAAAVARL
jgi:O-antigen ligase